ncbi:hypothetical protein ACSQ67_013487 [Phaseolus vulgaris]
MSSLTFTAEVASSFFGLAYRNPKPFTLSLPTSLLPLLRRTTTRSQSLSAPFPLRPARRFTVAATTAAPPHSEESDASTVIPPTIAFRQPSSPASSTTLLNHILTAEHGKRIAVIENEFGEVDIDGSLVAAKAAGAEDIMMLNNGCLCCTVRGDLVRMISELVAKKKGKFDHIVIETTGLANPAPIIQTFYAEENIFNDVKLDGVVTLVDAKHADFHLDEVKPKGVVNEAVEQIAYADRIIVNKTDLVGEPDIASLVQRIRKINSLANLKRTEYGKVNLDYVLGIGGFDLESTSHKVLVLRPYQSYQCRFTCLDAYIYIIIIISSRFGIWIGIKHHDHHSHDHTHDPGVSSVSIVCEGSLDLEKANMWLGNLLLDRSEDIYRMKGLLSVEGMNERFVFQASLNHGS